MIAQLPSGNLTIELAQHHKAQFQRLLEIGQRQNPKRGFLLISKVLGKHLPVQPRVMLETYQQLASLIHQVCPDVPQTSTWIGMAETATALGEGVFEAYQLDKINHQSMYLNTTRYQLEHQTLSFEESHSHAPHHLLHLSKAHLQHFASSTHLLLIDDEISTGQTLLRLAKAFKQIAPRLEKVILVSLTDFLGKNRQTVLSQFPVPTCSVSLLESGLSFVPNPHWQAALPVTSVSQSHLAPASPNRLGTRASGFHRPYIDRLATQLAQDIVSKEVQVIGTGEYQFEPFLLALALEQKGLDVTFRASTRSPILDYGVIQSREICLDPYGQGVENYLYNNQHLGNVIACAETNFKAYLPFDNVRYVQINQTRGEA